MKMVPIIMMALDMEYGDSSSSRGGSENPAC